ncbi:MAG TPA: (Fe-S)-binding protein [Alphaproteobacteria bacterium]|nr:(Fe-S)-binding protein [Alphaproteobacteria bacterium]
MAERIRVGLFVTCLVDLFRPSVGFASVKLLEAAGCAVEVPLAQTCCGQPAYNSGDREDARALARLTIDAFQPCAYLVAPSGSCAGMISRHYPALLKDDPVYGPKAEALAARAHELVEFLTRILSLQRVPSPARYEGRVTYHDSCSALRELGLDAEPRKLLDTVEGLKLVELPDREACCGFGGTFCVKYPEISTRMVEAKTAAIAATGANTLASADLGCLMNIAGRLRREGKKTQVRHIAEILAGVTDAPAIGAGRG